MRVVIAGIFIYPSVCYLPIKHGCVIFSKEIQTIVQKVNTQPFTLKSIQQHMCLYTKQLLPRRAKEPITVYKMVYKKCGMYFTPFMHKPISKYGHIDASGPLTGNPKFNADRIYHITTVSNGYIHAYIDLENAKQWCRFCNGYPARNYKIMECIIEPGTLYYKNNTEICARSLTTKGIIY